MDIDIFPAHELETVFRVLRTALAPTISLEAPARSFLATYANITGHTLDKEPIACIAAGDVRIDGEHPRKRLVQLAALAALLARPAHREAVAFVQALARQLGVRDSAIDVLLALERGRHGRARLLVLRRGIPKMIKEAWLAGGIGGVLRFYAALLFKAAVNRDRLPRYKRLGLLPEGTLGRSYWAHTTALGYGFPGEPGGIAESVVYHDIGHVLTGHDTTPRGEIQQGSFQAGSRRDDGFFFVLFVVLQFHHGIRITPASPAEVGHFDPACVLRAIHRGAKCGVDITHQWDYWPLMALPLDEARRRCGLLPQRVCP